MDETGREGRWRRVNNGLTAWAVGRSPWWRMGVLGWLLFIALGYHLGYRDTALFAILSVFPLMNAAIHEGGHFIMSLTALQWLHVAAGTLFELGAPVAAAWNFIRQRDWFALSVCGAWLATGLYGVSVYMADARAQRLPFFRPFGLTPTIHDWHYMFSGMGVLALDTRIAAAVEALAVVVMWASIGFGLYMVWLMWRNPDKAAGGR